MEAETSHQRTVIRNRRFHGGVVSALLFILMSISGWAGDPLAPGTGGKANPPAARGDASDLPILQKWSGDFPVAQIERLPADRREERVGYIDDPATFAAVWEAFKPGEPLPVVDFQQTLVVFSRNVNFYNRTSIARVTVQDGVAEVMAIETMTSRPGGGQSGHGAGRDSPRGGGICLVGG